jgi:ABC-2 type transport system permease protein
MLNRILTLIRKELLAVWRDKKSRAVLIIPPLMQLFIFALAATLDVKNVPIGILNKDSGEHSIELIQRFYGSPMINKVIFLNSVGEIENFLDNQRGVLVVHFNEQFSRDLDSKKQSDLQIILDGRKSNTAQIVAGYFNTIVDQYNKDTSKDIGYRLQNTQLLTRNWYNPNLIYYWYNVPSLCGILTVVIALLVTGLSVARERELGTFDQLLVSPLTPIEILIGKAIPGVIIGIAEGTLIVLAAIFVFQIPFLGSFALLYAGMLVFVFSVVGFGLFISALSATQQQAILGTFIFLSPAVTLSGFATPIENMPQWLQYITYANPLRYFLVIARGEFLKNMPADIVWANIWPMIIIAVLTLTGATLFFRRRLG